MLPRREKTYGRWAWLPNALLWMVLVHAFLPWIFIAGLPGMLVTTYPAQRPGTTWASIIIHGTPVTSRSLSCW